jgi:hypothetical protein
VVTGDVQKDGEFMGKLVDFIGFSLKAAEDSLVEKIVDYASQSRFNSDMEAATLVYWHAHNSPGSLARDVRNLDEWQYDDDWDKVDALTARFHDWFLFDYKLQSGLRMVETFDRDCSGVLNVYERQLLSSWLNSYFGVFRIDSLNKENLVVRDILDDKLFFVDDEEDEIESCLPGKLLAGRPLLLGVNSRFSGTIMTVDDEYKLSVEEALKIKSSWRESP